MAEASDLLAIEPPRFFTIASIGGMLLGYYDERGRLVFSGSVGTGKGWTAAFLHELRAGPEQLRDDACSFEPPPPREIAREARWVRAALVAEVQFTEWTSDGVIRQPTHGTAPGRCVNNDGELCATEADCEARCSGPDRDGPGYCSHSDRSCTGVGPQCDIFCPREFICDLQRCVRGCDDDTDCAEWETCKQRESNRSFCDLNL